MALPDGLKLASYIVIFPGFCKNFYKVSSLINFLSINLPETQTGKGVAQNVHCTKNEVFHEGFLQ